MSYILFAISSVTCAVLCLKFEGTLPPGDTYIILAILSAAEAIGIHCRK